METTCAPISASTAAWYPDPVPTSRTVGRPEGCRQGPSSASDSVMRATMYGCEIVWPWPMG